jgi:hypothetical protein
VAVQLLLEPGEGLALPPQPSLAAHSALVFLPMAIAPTESGRPHTLAAPPILPAQSTLAHIPAPAQSLLTLLCLQVTTPALTLTPTIPIQLPTLPSNASTPVTQVMVGMVQAA